MKKRTRNVFDPASSKPFKLSRSRLYRFVQCPRCFYLDRRLAIDRVSMPAFLLNSATDTLLKKEFDQYREKAEPHPLMIKRGIDAVPFVHPDLERWRANFTGIQFHHKPTNFLLFGAVDDVWVQPDGTLIVVDYKSTSTTKEITLKGKWKEAYKWQMEFYQWLLRQNGFKVSSTGWFVYVNGQTDRPAFNGKMDFTVQLLQHTGSDDWVEETVVAAYRCLMSSDIPDSGAECEWCAYRELARGVGVDHETE